MALLALLFLLFGGGLAWRLAARASRHDRLFAWLFALSLASILLWFATAQWTDLSFRLLPWDDWLFFERPVLFLAVFLLLALCLRRLERRRALLVGVIAAIFGLYALAETAGPLGLPLWAPRLSDRTDRADDGQQSTGWSCSAAVLAWALRQEGLPVSERQVALLAGTNPLHGTVNRGLVRAAHRLGRPAYVLIRARWEDLVTLPKPLLTGWYLGNGVMHEIAVVGVDSEGVDVHDPLLGDQRYALAEFRQRWQRDLLVLAERQR